MVISVNSVLSVVTFFSDFFTTEDTEGMEKKSCFEMLKISSLCVLCALRGGIPYEIFTTEDKENTEKTVLSVSR